MSWTCMHGGKVLEVEDGKDFMIAEKLPYAHGGGFKVVTTTYRQNGSHSAQSRDYPGIRWIAEDEPLPNSHPRNLDLGYSGTIDKAFAKVGQAMAETNDTFFKLGDALAPGSDKEPEMKNTSPTGLRVSFPCPQTGFGHLGTIVNTGSRDPLPRGVVLICSDIASADFNDKVEYTGEGHGVVINRRHVNPFPDQTSSEAFAGIPKHIGVTVREMFEWDNVMFTRRVTGRLLYFDGDQATVSWNFARSKNFYMSDPIQDPKSGKPPIQWPNCYSVPAATLKWCRWDSNAEVCKVWPGTVFQPSTLTLKNDDYVVYTGSRTLRISGESHYAVARGAILKITGNDGRGLTYTGVLVGGCDEKAQGLQVRLDHTSIALLGFPYISAGINVEIVASVEFKKQELRGRRGVVVLPTDADGDIGIQFQEDIGAGSLDGVGKNLHCLYVPVGSVQKISG